MAAPPSVQPPGCPQGAFVGWWEGDALLAVGLLEGAVGRFAVLGGRERGVDLGEHVAHAWSRMAAGPCYRRDQ